VVAGLVKTRWYRSISVTLAVLGFLSLLSVGSAVGQLHPGLWERGAVYPIFVWQMLSAVLLIARRRADTRRGVVRQHNL
jgi:peptidoglycan/LPS O-acetylase OafA/YrhL